MVLDQNYNCVFQIFCTFTPFWASEEEIQHVHCNKAVEQMQALHDLPRRARRVRKEALTRLSKLPFIFRGLYLRLVSPELYALLRCISVTIRTCTHTLDVIKRPITVHLSPKFYCMHIHIYRHIYKEIQIYIDTYFMKITSFVDLFSNVNQNSNFPVTLDCVIEYLCVYLKYTSFVLLIKG